MDEFSFGGFIGLGIGVVAGIMFMLILNSVLIPDRQDISKVVTKYTQCLKETNNAALVCRQLFIKE